MSRTLAFIIISLIILFPPFALGGVHPWSEALLQALVIAVAFLCAVKSISQGAIEYRKDILNSFFLLFALYIAFQLFSGVTKDAYATSLRLRMSLVYAALFLSVTNLIQKKSEIDGVLFTITLSGFFVSLLGIFQKIIPAERIYWLIDAAHPRFFAAFVNENHAACYISVTALVTLGSVFAGIYGNAFNTKDLPFRKKLSAVLEVAFNQKVLFKAFSFLIMVTALYISGSRGAAVFFAASAALFLVTAFSRTGYKKMIWLILFLLLAVYGLLNWIGIEGAPEGLRTIIYSREYVGRMEVLEEAGKMFSDHSLFGVGIGAFANVFPMYRRGFETAFYLHLHNEAFQFLTEAGIVGGAMIAAPLILFFLKFIGAGRRTKDPYKYYISAGLFFSFFYLGLHGLVDFGMRINAISSLAVILLALAALTIRLDDAPGIFVRMDTRKIWKIKNDSFKRWLYAGASIAFLCAVFMISAPFAAYRLARDARSASAFEKAIRLDRGNDGLYYRYSGFLLDEANNLGLEKTAVRQAVYNRAKKYAEEAARLNPYKTAYMVRNGWIEFKLKDYEKANALFAKAVSYEPDNSRLQLSYAYTLFLEGLSEKNSSKRQALLKKGLSYYRQANFFSRHIHLYSIIQDKAIYNVLRKNLRKEGIVVE